MSRVAMMDDDSNLIWDISPAETPFLNTFTIAEKTVMRFAGPSKRIEKWVRSRKRRKPVIHEWVTERINA